MPDTVVDVGLVAGKRNSSVSYYQTLSRLQSGGTWRQVTSGINVNSDKIFSRPIATNTKKERLSTAATGDIVLELVCTRRSPVSPFH